MYLPKIKTTTTSKLKVLAYRQLIYKLWAWVYHQLYICNPPRDPIQRDWALWEAYPATVLLWNNPDSQITRGLTKMLKSNSLYHTLNISKIKTFVSSKLFTISTASGKYIKVKTSDFHLDPILTLSVNYSRYSSPCSYYKPLGCMVMVVF